MLFDDVLRVFFENNLRPGMAYGSGVPNSSFCGQGTLVWQDGTACSSGYCFSDVIQKMDDPDNFYVYTVCSGCGVSEFEEVHTCKSMKEVLVALLRYNGDSNTCGDMMFDMVKSLDVTLLENRPDLWDQLLEKSTAKKFAYQDELGNVIPRKKTKKLLFNFL
jgi:hypothetical protein